jgi:hypothetical protein
VFPNTLVFPLAKTTYDHNPCVVKIATQITKSNFFRFENFWLKRPRFFPLVEKVWKQPVYAKSSAARISVKLKALRYELKTWGKVLSHMKTLIGHCNTIILFFISWKIVEC